MTAPTYFTVVGDFKSIVADTMGDTDADPDSVSLLATVTFTPRINDGDLILATNASPRPTAFVAAPISGTVGSDGILKLRDAGSSGFPGLSYTPVRLLADTPLLELDGDLFYDVTFSNVSYNGRFITLNGFTFQAPTSDVTLNLVTVARAPGQPATAITKIAPTGVRFTGSNMVFSFSGVDIPEPLPLSSITGPQGPQGPQGIQGQAGVSLDINGTVSTYANLPSSADDGEAYVVAADGKLYYRFDGAWPADGEGVPFVGPQGPQGPQGSVGATGATGSVGATGASGLQGQVGATGATGPVGATGATGLAGQSVSLKGAVATYSLLPGSATNGDGYILLTDNLLYVWNGSWPVEGSGVPFVGPAGATGATGLPGATGASGPQGEVGATGATGASGASGQPGATGASGTPGSVGATGATGATGAVGASGASGTPGQTRSVSTITANTTLGSASGTDYVVFSNIATIPASGDPNLSDRVAMLHFDGSDGATGFTDSSVVNGTWTATGSAALSTSVKKFGSASLAFSGGYVSTSAASSNFTFGTGAFTIEMWVYVTSSSTSNFLIDFRPLNTTSGAFPFITIDGGNLNYVVNGISPVISGAITGGSWHHIAVARSGSDTKLFLNGTQLGSTYNNSTSLSVGTNRPVLGINANLVNLPASGLWIDDLRITKGVARYTTTFTAPTEAFADSYTAPVQPTITLPTATGGNTSLYTVNNDNAETLTVATTSSQTINGSATGTLTSGQKITLISNGSNWVSPW